MRQLTDSDIQSFIETEQDRKLDIHINNKVIFQYSLKGSEAQIKYLKRPNDIFLRYGILGPHPCQLMQPSKKKVLDDA